jgi:carbamoyltransferase
MDLAAAGGVFLNILANSRLEREAGFSRYFVPSAPHDAGIAIGCALLGYHIDHGRVPYRACSDRLGPTYD